MIWNVYLDDVNRREIKTYNVFNHSTFNEDVKELLQREMTYKEFSEKLESYAMYCFWSKCEYEVIATSFPPYIDKEEMNRVVEEYDSHPYRMCVNLETAEKIDVYGQLKMNWKHFVDYVWNFKKESKEVIIYE